MIEVGVGSSTLVNTLEASSEAIGQARTLVPGAIECALVFAGPQHDASVLLESVRTAIGGPFVLFGGSTTGIITNHELSYTGSEIGVALIPKGNFTVSLFSANAITGAEESAGRSIGEHISSTQKNDQPSSLLLLYDSIARTSQNGPPSLNLATPLLRGLIPALSETQTKLPTIAGVGLMADPFCSLECLQWNDAGIASQMAMALTFEGDLTMRTVILHGCRPMGGYLTITKAFENIVAEIDGMPAVDRILEVLGPDSPYRAKDFPMFLTLGLNRGDPFMPFREENYANRLCFAVDENAGSLIMFENDLASGDRIQLMRRSIDHSYIRENIDAHFESWPNETACFAFYIDCLGRCARYCGAEKEEAAEVQAAMNERSIPLLGIYSGVEIAQVGSTVQALDWTGVLCVFSETR